MTRLRISDCFIMILNYGVQHTHKLNHFYSLPFPARIFSIKMFYVILSINIMNDVKNSAHSPHIFKKKINF